MGLGPGVQRGASSTTYFFRMAKVNGVAFGTYTTYPVITVPPDLLFSQEDYRWYASKNNVTPDTPLANENTAPTGVLLLEILRLRVNLALTGSNLAAAAEGFRLQYATSTGGEWRDVGGLGAVEIWRGYDNTGTTDDGATLPSVLLGSSDVPQSYEEKNPSAANPNPIIIGQRAEWDWSIQNNTAPSGTYFFRMVMADGAELGG